MSDIAFGAVRSSGRRTLPKRDRTTPVLRSAATGLCAVAAIGIVGAIALGAAGWILSITIGGNPRIHSEAPMGPRRLALADTEFKMAGPAPSAKMLIAEVLAKNEIRTPAIVEPPVRIARIEAIPLPPLRPQIAAAPQAVALAVPQAAPQIALAIPMPAPAPIKREPVRQAMIPPPPPPELASKTAVYDISARTVFLPNGQKLEAHSGLGEKMDDPRFVKVRMHGPTPPNVYDLSLREQIFHGVRAIRLNPVNENAMFDRDGMLAHTYMLGPNGQSNGCVSFRDYDKFLQAFLKGQVDRLVVVPSLGKTPYHVVSAQNRRDVKYASAQ
jgi:hypothetical protein